MADEQSRREDGAAEAEPQSPGPEARRHPWYADGTPSAVNAIIKRYREEAGDGRDVQTRAALLYEIGRLFEEHLGDPRQAHAHYQEALSAAPSFVPALRALRRHLVERRARPQALELLERGVVSTVEAAGGARLRRQRFDAA